MATAAIPLPTVFVRGTLQERLSLHCASVVRIRILAAVFRAYHALVFEYKQRIEDTRVNEDYTDLFVLFSQLVRVAWRHE